MFKKSKKKWFTPCNLVGSIRVSPVTTFAVLCGVGCSFGVFTLTGRSGIDLADLADFVDFTDCTDSVILLTDWTSGLEIS